ncbi:MAG TPA: hypothetical protein PK095_01240, partial [Myxococcota bacterium]|nr:hypothetical protein [Myxococcota bacterium]
GDTHGTDWSDTDPTPPDSADTSDPTDTDTTGTDTSEPGPDGDTTAPDTTGPSPIAATPGARCEPAERIGLVQIEDQGTLYASAWVHDRTNPSYGEPASATATCAFYQFAPSSPCPSCELDETCGLSGLCEPLPLVRRDVVLELAAGGSTQRLESSGELWGEVTLGRTVSLSLSFGDVEVTLPATTVPDPLADVAGTLSGSYDDPQGLSLTWAPVVGDTQVFTHVPMNHHVAEPTFTQCATPASTGSMQIGGDMLKPLAVSTGLEFQGIEHVRFAAAETALGCVEFRYQIRAYVPLF